MQNHKLGTIVAAWNRKNPVLGIVSKITDGPYGEVRYNIDWSDGSNIKTLYIHERINKFIDTYKDLEKYDFDVQKTYESYKG